MLGYRDAQEQFEAKYPGFLEACEALVRFVLALSQNPNPNDKTTHLSAVANQVGVAWDAYAAIVSLVMTGFPVPAMSSAVISLKSPSVLYTSLNIPNC